MLDYLLICIAQKNSGIPHGDFHSVDVQFLLPYLTWIDAYVETSN